MEISLIAFLGSMIHRELRHECCVLGEAELAAIVRFNSSQTDESLK